MNTTIKVLKENLISSLASTKEDNVSIADVVIDRKKLLEVLKLQKQPDADLVTLTYGNISWRPVEGETGGVDNEPCIRFNFNHTTMHFLNRPKVKSWNEPKIIPLNFIDHRDITKTDIPGVPLDPREFIKALSFVVPCVAVERSRPALNCILFESGDDSINLIAADGFRLGIINIPVKGIPEDNILIDTDDIKKLLTFLKAVKTRGRGKDDYPDVYLSYDDNTIKFATEKGFIELLKQPGTFPNYKLLIPNAGSDNEFIASDMLKSVKALKNIANDGSGIIRLHFTTGDPTGNITLTATSAEYADSTVECSAIVESDCKIGMNNRYLIDMLKLCKDTRIIVKIKDQSSPALFTIGDDKQYIIMPMFVQW